MKTFILFVISAAMLLSLSACSAVGKGGESGTGGGAPVPGGPDTAPPDSVPSDVEIPDGTKIVLSDGGITVDGSPISDDPAAPVYAASDIVYYEAGHDFTYGEGTKADEHSADEAAAHTVVHISAPGVYVLSGSLSAGQIAVDLGEDAQDDPQAVVDLVLDGVDITCTVAPAVIFYSVYECGDKDNASPVVDTSAAGANVYIADGTENTVNGSYVARIYKSCELNEAGTGVVSSKKLHKYDGALYSKMTMNVTGNDGRLTINAENEGLDSELHLTINGGVIDIFSGNDGINTNEDGVSVTTVNAGALTVTVNGSTGEGDGIDSNGWLVINGGAVRAYACADSADSGIDSDMGIIINGGQIVATGSMLDAIDASSTQKYAVFRLNDRGGEGVTYTLRDADGKDIMSVPTVNAFTVLIVSTPELTGSGSALYNGDTLAASSSSGGSGLGGRPGGMERPPEGGGQPGMGERPDGPIPENPPDGFGADSRPEPPDGLSPGDFGPGSSPTPPEGGGTSV